MTLSAFARTRPVTRVRATAPPRANSDEEPVETTNIAETDEPIIIATCRITATYCHFQRPQTRLVCSKIIWRKRPASFDGGGRCTPDKILSEQPPCTRRLGGKSATLRCQISNSASLSYAKAAPLGCHIEENAPDAVWQGDHGAAPTSLKTVRMELFGHVGPNRNP
jgi:hypothetical protein